MHIICKQCNLWSCFERNKTISWPKIVPLYKNTIELLLSYLVHYKNCIFSLHTWWIIKKVALIGNFSYTCLHQLQRLRARCPFGTLIHTYITDVLWKLFVHSSTFLYTYMSESLFCFLNQPYRLLNLLFSVYFHIWKHGGGSSIK